MDENEFNKIIKDDLKKVNLTFNKQQISQLYEYMHILLEWNKNINLTRITNPQECIKKHFIDSLSVVKYINKKDKIIDVGTGAGFPGVPIKIAMPDTDIVLLDTINKKIKFLDVVIKKLELKYIKTIHGRAEDYGRDNKYREKYDIAIARAVAPLNILIEYVIPFIKVGGMCLCMKGTNITNELQTSQKAMKLLGAEIIGIEEFLIPNTDIKRSILTLRKKEHTNKEYPRKAGIPKKYPL